MSDTELIRITAALTSLAPTLGGDTVTGVQRLTGGASLQTWRFTLQTSAGDKTLILRRRATTALAAATALPLATEAALLRLAHTAGVPVPRVRHVPAATDDLGEALIVDFVAGETLGRRIVAGPAFAEIRPHLGQQAGTALARIHAIPPAAVPGLPHLSAADTLARYEQIHRRIGAVRPVLEAAFRWLAEPASDTGPTALLHGDFRTGNLMIDPTDGITAVLDWELAHTGEPAEDIGWLMVNSWRFGVTDKPVGGFCELTNLLAAYEQAGGTPPPIPRIRFWQALGSLKWATMCLMMFESHASDTEPSLERAMIGRRVSECEADLLTLMDPSVC
jgi:aminoglycoside phosphotransferase (APT) family kinase protein